MASDVELCLHISSALLVSAGRSAHTQPAKDVYPTVFERIPTRRAAIDYIDMTYDFFRNPRM